MGQHPNSLKNLRPPWKPGQSGNPSGQRRAELSDLIDGVLSEELPRAKVKGETQKKTIIRGIAARAVQGDLRASEFLFDRIYGKPFQSSAVDVTLDDAGRQQRLAELRAMIGEHLKEPAEK
jgi:uncharacterized protein DUF5681